MTSPRPAILAALCVIALALPCTQAAPPIIELPKASWEPSYFESINSLTTKAAWTPLRQTNLPEGSLEVRVWIGFGLTGLQGILLRREGDRWSGFVATDSEPVQVRAVMPASGWAALWKKVDALGLLTLPDSSTLPDEQLVLDGESYVVEFNDGQHYRTYQYGNPQSQAWPEAKKIIGIVKVLNDELALNGSANPTPTQGLLGSRAYAIIGTVLIMLTAGLGLLLRRRTHAVARAPK